MMWGKHKENGIWLAKCWRWTVMLGGSDRLIHLAAGPLRLRLMKP